MLDYRDQIQNVHDFLVRSGIERRTPYTYEVHLATGTEEIALTARTAGTEKFTQDIENAVEKAKQAHGILKVDVFGGKSNNSKRISTYTINVSGLMNPQENLKKDEVELMIEKKLGEMPQPQNGLNDLGGLLGMVTGTGDNKKGMEGLFGLFKTISGNNEQLNQLQFQKQLDDFKFQTEQQKLNDKYESLSSENATLRTERERFEKECARLKEENVDLESRLAGYAPQELMKRVSVGVVTGIGSRLLANSPKAAQLFGLTSDELKGALGMLDDDTTDSSAIPDVEISEVDVPKTPEERKKAEIIENVSEELKKLELQEVAKIAAIIGQCLEQPELTVRLLAFIRQLTEEPTGETEIDLETEEANH